jgi:GDPmannose 4,6-dehydratase
MNKTALITGITGQDGAYLSKLLLEKKYKVYGLVRRVVNRQLGNLQYLGVDKDIHYVDGDMTDECSLINAVKTIRPDEVYNLAAQSFVASSWDYPVTTTNINALGVLRLLNAIKNHSPETKFYQASTSEMFGNNSTNGMQTTETAFKPCSPYAIAKLYAHWTTVNFRESYGMFACCGILFNHETPLRGLEFVTRKITDAVARIKLGLSDSISLGNLDATRDWGFGGDYVKAMYMMLQQDEPDDYIICTGHNHSVRDFLSAAFGCVDIRDWEQYVKVDPRFLRPKDLVHLHGDNSKAVSKLGWEPETSFEQLVEMMVKADLERYSK